MIKNDFNNKGEMIKLEGFDELEDDINQLVKKSKELEGEHEVPLDQILTDDFISKHTKFQNADEMFQASGFKMDTVEDWEAIPEDEWDVFIKSISSFADWEAMYGQASEDYLVSKLGF